MYLFSNIETGNYLKIEPHSIEFNILYADLKDLGIVHSKLSDAESINDLLQDFGLPLSQIRSKFKLTSSQFELVNICLDR